MTRQYILIFTLLLGYSTFGQKNLKEANSLFERLAYAEAATAYEAYLKDAPDVSAQTWKHIGETYYNLKDYVKASEAFMKWYNMEGAGASLQNSFLYYDTLRRLMEYEKAHQLMERYLKSYGNPDEYGWYSEERSRFEELRRADTLYTLKNLEFNSQYADFGGSFYQNAFVFTSSRNKEANQIYERNNTPYLSLYKILNPNAGTDQDVQLFNKELETPYHDGTSSFTADGKYLYYASSYQTGKKKVFQDDKRNYFKIYRVDLTQKNYKKELLDFNGEDYSTGQPFITPDGKRLFFSSDMPGGYGKADIYVCDVYEDGTTSKPVNLGPNINTLADDFFPFYKNGVLYFSSAGHVGFGGLDNYKSFYKDGLYGVAINLGPVINTNADDFAYIECREPQMGFISSDRAGGQGDDDIYGFDYNLDACIQYLSGTVYNLETQEPVPGATVTVYLDDKQKYQEVKTDQNGTYNIEVLCETDYFIEAFKAGFSKDGLELSTDILPDRKMEMLDFKLKDLSEIFTIEDEIEKIKVDPIYFDYYRYNINNVAAIQLQKVVDVMNAYPDMVIKIESHTDQRGTDYFNKVLSTNRAEATRDWLINNGISPQRIESAIGYGESRPVNSCDEDGINCTEVEYSENRRSEFIVIKR